jgi:Chalcone isomerase-like
MKPIILRLLAATSALAFLAAASPAEDVVEPASGVTFPVKRDGATLLGTGLRVKKIAFIKAKVYAVGLYVGDAALAGPLSAHRGKTADPAFFKDLVWGDFPKEVVLHFVRNVGQGRIQDAMREALEGAAKGPLDAFVSYFPEVKTGQECILRWGSGGVLETTMAGESRPPIRDKAFAAAVFALYVGEHPLQDDIKAGLTSRAAELLKP